MSYRDEQRLPDNRLAFSTFLNRLGADPTANTMDDRRTAFIHGLRRLAALQVVLLQYCSTFLPFAARTGTSHHYGWEATVAPSPLFFLIDGYSAVSLFFLMNGFVLAPSFMRATSASVSKLSSGGRADYDRPKSPLSVAAVSAWISPRRCA